MTRRAHASLLMALLLVLSGCTLFGGSGKKESLGKPPAGEPPADAVVKALAQALDKGSLDKLAFTGDASAAKTAQKDYTVVMGGMDGLTPASVKPGTINYRGDGVASVELDQTWQFSGKKWTYRSTAALGLDDGTWKVAWEPAIVHPQLTDGTRLRHTRDLPPRAGVFDSTGKAVMEEFNLSVLGIDKANLAQDQWASSARRLAEQVKIDVDGYVKKVEQAGEKAFVPAKSLRKIEIEPPMLDIPGVLEQDEKGTRAIADGFAQSILGAVAPATPEQVEASKGFLIDGDVVGVSGLQKRYDAQLRGTPGQKIDLVKRKDATPKEGEDEHVDVTLYSHDATPGKRLDLSLKADLQTKAEEALADVTPVASLVAIDTKTGGVLAAANSKARPDNPDATFGRYAPGSTFKVVTSLAMIRQGMNAQSRVECPAVTTVNGRQFKNYSDYPTDKLGDITLADAVANSCNTTFILQSKKLPAGALKDAAASLGFGVDHDAGFPVFYGSLPDTDDPVVAAANTIGQGQVESSPLSMAGVAASVAAGKTRVPWLVKGHQPSPKAKPLTEDEAKQLQDLMHAVVNDGSARGLQGIVEGAKTGTAEFGSDVPPKTHAWMIVYKGDMAIAVMVSEGQSGSTTAAPIIRKVLS